jgi:hypothetical protein
MAFIASSGGAVGRGTETGVVSLKADSGLNTSEDAAEERAEVVMRASSRKRC